MKRKLISGWLWWLLRWGLVGLASLATLLAVVVTEENWRGKRAWQNYQREAAAKGDPVDQLRRPTNALPHELNFARSGVFAALVGAEGGSAPPGGAVEAGRPTLSTTRADGTAAPIKLGNWSKAQLTDLRAWQQYYRADPTNSSATVFPRAPQAQSPAADVLLALSIYDSTLEQWRRASQRPYSRFAEDYDANDFQGMSRLLAYLAQIKSCCSVLELRALAELGDGQAAAALEDVQLLLRLNESLRQEPLLIAHLVSVAIMGIAVQPIYEGLAQQKWSEEQLVVLEKELAAKDFLQDYAKAMRGERAFSLRSLENMRLAREYRTMEEESGTNRLSTVSFRFVPDAFFYQNELSFARLHDELSLPLVDLDRRVASPEAARRAAETVRHQMSHYRPYKILALMTFPAVSKSVMKFAHAQVQVDLARVACSLERQRLAQGHYPKGLDLLAPQFMEKLPHDIINGQPLHYHLTEVGQFVLYSVGWNGTDEGGQTSPDREKGDWVWRYPTD